MFNNKIITTMKKILFLFVFAAFLAVQVSAQNQIFKKGDKAINLGIGFGSTFYSSFYTSRTPAVSASFEYGIVDGILNNKASVGVGGYFGFASAKYEDYYKATNFIIGPRGTFHYALLDKLDTYAGVTLGYNAYKFKSYSGYTSGYTGSSGLASAFFAGARYHFTDNIAVMGEVGYGISIITVGLGIKL
jgi:hypothetical protein